jgi:heme/copper-type cytochrome/quinol oxidase subunit 2
MPHPHRDGRSLVVIVIYLAGFAILILWLARHYLLPAYGRLDGATPQERQWLGAWSVLLMSLVLVLLVMGLILTFRAGRYFTGRGSKPAKTDYPDAWQESGRRARGDP